MLIKFGVLTGLLALLAFDSHCKGQFKVLSRRGINPKIRVQVMSRQKEVVVSGMDLNRKMLISGKERSYNGRMGIKFNCRNLSKKLKKGYQSVPQAKISSKTGLITLKRSKFRGDLTILAAANRKSCDVVNEIPLESYISSLLAKEMNGSWPVEALKAQAVAARTYAIHKIESGQVSKDLGYEAFYDLESSEKHQVGGTFFDITPNTKKAAIGTHGEVLVLKNGKLTPTFFHAQCGGRTIKPSDVWENEVLGYHSKICPYCKISKKRKWERTISKQRFRDFLKWIIERSPGSDLIGLNAKNRIMLAPDAKDKLKLRIYLGEAVLVVGKVMLRKFFGRTTILSNRFRAQILNNGKIKINGKGHGHGVGMCQLGALYLAKQGWNYRKILAYYFPGHQIKKVY